MRCQLVTSLDAAVRIEADLIGIWGVYALKADRRRINNKRINIDNSGNTREVSSLRRRTASIATRIRIACPHPLRSAISEINPVRATPRYA